LRVKIPNEEVCKQVTQWDPGVKPWYRVRGTSVWEQKSPKRKWVFVHYKLNFGDFHYIYSQACSSLIAISAQLVKIQNMMTVIEVR